MEPATSIWGATVVAWGWVGLWRTFGPEERRLSLRRYWLLGLLPWVLAWWLS